MPSSGKDYRKLYRLQDKFLDWWSRLDLPFYLTGGTALGRYYLGHRYSEYLDFFVNADPLYKDYISILNKEIKGSFGIDIKQSLYSEDFTRLFIHDEESFLKIEFINEVSYRAGKPVPMEFGLLDIPSNILSYKLTALVGRDEPKDIFDIIYIAMNYSFEWKEVFYDAKQKAVLNEIDIEERFSNFHLKSLDLVDWMINSPDKLFLAAQLKKVADDFLFGKSNSVGSGKSDLKEARPKIL